MEDKKHKSRIFISGPNPDKIHVLSRIDFEKNKRVWVVKREGELGKSSAEYDTQKEAIALAKSYDIKNKVIIVHKTNGNQISYRR